MKGCLTSLIAVIASVCTVFLVLALVFSFFSSEDAVLESLPDYETKELYTSGGFQDYTDYAKYTYEISETALIQNSYFLPVTDGDIPMILTYIDDFEGWVETCTDFPSEAYDFDKSILTEGDYYYILNKYEEPGKEFWNYNIYYFDLDTQILYYFHNNI